jgi:hypothetical protein
MYGGPNIRVATETFTQAAAEETSTGFTGRLSITRSQTRYRQSQTSSLIQGGEETLGWGYGGARGLYRSSLVSRRSARFLACALSTGALRHRKFSFVS